MAVLKTQCPKCDAKIRLTVDGAGTHKTECLKCGHAFTAKTEPEDAPAKKAAPQKSGPAAKETARASAGAKKAKVVARAAEDDDDDDDDEEEDEAPKKKKKKGAGADGGK